VRVRIGVGVRLRVEVREGWWSGSDREGECSGFDGLFYLVTVSTAPVASPLASNKIITEP
jgi:hypothetical protein